MIAPDSTSYPTLAVIQRFNLPEELHQLMYEAGHVAHQAMRRGECIPDFRPFAQRMWSRVGDSAPSILLNLASNHLNAAEAHGYWAIDKEPSE